MFEALRPGHKFISHFGTASWLYQVLSNNEYELSCLRTEHRAPGEDQTRNFGVNNILLNSNNTSIKQIHTKLSGSDNKHLVLIDLSKPATLRLRVRRSFN